MEEKITWEGAARDYLANSYKWRLDHLNEDDPTVFLDRIDKVLRDLLSGRRLGRRAETNPNHFRTDVGYTLYVVYEFVPHGLHIHLMRSHRQGPNL